MKKNLCLALLALALPTVASAACRSHRGLQLCGTWGADKHVRGTVQVRAGGFGFELTDADIWADGPNYSGTASFQLPSLLGGTLPYTVRGEVSVASGRDSIEVDGIEIYLGRANTALVIDVEDGVNGNIGGVTVSGNRSSIVIVPETRTYFIGGDFIAAGFPAVERGALGVSVDGKLNYQGTHPIYDGETRTVPSIRGGHLYMQGQMQVGSYPVYVFGRTFLDLDRDNDRRLCTADNESNGDFTLAAEGEVTLGYSAARTSFSVPIGDGALIMEGGDDGSLTASGRAYGPELFADTPLAALSSSAQWEIYGDFDLQGGDVDSFIIGGSARHGTIGGLNLGQLAWELHPEGMWAFGRYDIPGLANVDLSGEIAANGSYTLSGSTHLRNLGTATVTATQSQVDATLNLNVPGLRATLTGSARPNRDGGWPRMTMSGTATMSVLGVTITSAQVSYANGRISVSGRTRIGPTTIALSGSVEPRSGRLSMSGSGRLSLGRLNLSSVSFRVDRNLMTWSKRYRYAGQNFNLSGSVNSRSASASASRSIRYSATFAGTGVSLRGSVRLSASSSSGISARLSARACASILGGERCASVGGDVSSSGRVSVSFPVVGRKSIDVL